MIEDTGINRNIMECKARFFAVLADGFIVLIETLWNVKSGRKDTIETAVAVLIETLWNVKTLFGEE